MILSASSEVFQPAYAVSALCRRTVVPHLNAAFAASSLATLDCELRYVPIIMPADARQNYPARSRLLREVRIYDCAPQLDYDVFVNRTFDEQLKEYLSGIATSGPHLDAFGASKEQIAEFERIVVGSADRILAERPDLMRN